MKKKLLFLLAAVMCIAMHSCEKIEDILSFGDTSSVTVHIDAQAVLGGNQLSSVKVQSLVESVDCGLDSARCQLRVFSNGKPQIIAVTDEAGKLIMMFRGPVRDGATITINAQSTANALVTFNPLYGPIPASEYSALTSIIEASPMYQDYRQAVNTAIARGLNLTDTNNAQMLAMLHNLLRDLSEQAFAGQEQLEATAINASSFLNCYPLIAQSEGSSLTLRTAGNCPSYYGELYDEAGNVVQEVSVTAASRYAFMDNLNGSTGNNSYGNPTTIPFVEGGAYTLVLSCTEESALLDFYIRLVNNILGTLGADIDSRLVSAVTPLVRRAVTDMGIDITSIETDQVMPLLCRAYSVVIDYLRNEDQLLSGDANWDLGAVLLNRLNDVYTVLRSTTDALLRTSYNFVGNTQEDPGHTEPGVEVSAGNTTVIVRVIHLPGNGEIPPTLIPQEGIDIAIVSGNNQAAQAYRLLPTPLQVRVRTFDGMGNTSLANNYKVRFVVANGGGHMQNDVVLTHDGIATNYWTLGGGTSGLTQSAYAVVVDADGAEISSRVYFNALIANDRYRVSLCCDWANHTNYASQFDLDFTATGSNGIVPLFEASGRQWDYNGLSERFEMSGTINTATKDVDMVIAMYLADPYYESDTNIHFRTDRYQFPLQGTGFGVSGTLIWNGHDHGLEWGAGCGSYIWLEMLGANSNTPVKTRKPMKAPASKQGLMARK